MAKDTACKQTKKTKAVILVSDKIDLHKKSISRDKKGHFCGDKNVSFFRII